MRLGPKHPIRAAVGNIATYHESKGSIICALRAAFEACDLEIDFDGLPGDSGSVTWVIRPAETALVICDACSEKHAHSTFDNCIALQWHKMPSGRYEYNAYIS
ncbi:MAG: hypothetical protein ACYTFQ_28370 [Planctomycetota bacterium]|jgi:hypothetical protein